MREYRLHAACTSCPVDRGRRPREHNRWSGEGGALARCWARSSTTRSAPSMATSVRNRKGGAWPCRKNWLRRAKRVGVIRPGGLTSLMAVRSTRSEVGNWKPPEMRSASFVPAAWWLNDAARGPPEVLPPNQSLARRYAVLSARRCKHIPADTSTGVPMSNSQTDVCTASQSLYCQPPRHHLSSKSVEKQTSPQGAAP
jgi:hypothetical protein